MRIQVGYCSKRKENSKKGEIGRTFVTQTGTPMQGTDARGDKKVLHTEFS